jgi:hypothetical protein
MLTLETSTNEYYKLIMYQQQLIMNQHNFNETVINRNGKLN